MPKGIHNRLSDAEKMARGTFRPDKSEAVYEAKQAAKLLAFPRFREIPEPDLPLGEIGLKKYHELAKALFEADKLTVVTKMQAEQAAVMHAEISRRLTAAQPVTASMSDKLQRALSQLKIAEDVPTIASAGEKKSKFSRAGFSCRRSKPT